MFKKLLPILVAIALTSYANAGLRIGGGPVALPAGTTGPISLDIQFVNDSSEPVTLIGASVLSYTLSSSFFGGSGSAAPTLTNPIPTPSSAFVDLGTTSASAPLGTFGANNFVGFSVPVGNAITLGSVEVNIPADFLGEFILTSTSGEQFASIISLSLIHI